MILEQIVQNKRLELEIAKSRIPMEKIQKEALIKTPPLNLASVLDRDGFNLIAEVKKASPSRGIICKNFNPVQIAKTYSESGVAAISVLTERKYFQGSLDYLDYINHALGPIRPPLLRKDFIFDPYQIYESRAFGADAILLIAAILDLDQLKLLIELSHCLGLSCLVEAHNEGEVAKAVKSGAKIVGINNRDLKTFTEDINVTKRLRPLIPPDRIVVSESGITTRSDIEKVKQWGANAVLIGESLLTSGDIKAKICELL